MKSFFSVALLFFVMQTVSAKFIEIPEYSTSEPIYEQLWSSFKTDDCFMHEFRNLNEYKKRGKGFRRCRDNSISFVQPPSTGPRGWEGKCGQTYAANALYSLCAKRVEPAHFFNRYLRDITPGVRPTTLTRGLNGVFKDVADCPEGPIGWKYIRYFNEISFIKNIKYNLVPRFSHINLQQVNRNNTTYFRNPIAALILNPGGRLLHWITIIDQVDIKNSCHFVVNHWDNQYTVPCELIARWSNDVGKAYPIILKSFSMVVFND